MIYFYIVSFGLVTTNDFDSRVGKVPFVIVAGDGVIHLGTPKGLNKSAQGNALGWDANPTKSPERAAQFVQKIQSDERYVWD